MDKTLHDKLIASFDLGEFPPEEQEEILGEMGAIVTEGVLTRTVPMLSDEDGKLYDQLLESDDGVNQVFKFLNDKIPSFKEIVNDEVAMLEKTLR